MKSAEATHTLDALARGRSRTNQSSSRKVVYAALLANVLIAVTKFAAAAWTGSSAMLSEAVHSLVDTVNELLLLYGMRRASRPRDAEHPFGNGRELYFWSFIVALMVFALGAGVSAYEGVTHILDPVPMEDPVVNYVVLGLSFLLEFSSWWVALQEFRAAKGERDFFAAVGAAKDPTKVAVLLEDSAALVGLLIAFAGVFTAHLYDMPLLDGVASIGIALVLGMAGALLARRTKELLIGERSHPELERAILQIAARDPRIVKANGVLTTQLGPHQVLATLSLEFDDRLTTPEIEESVGRLEQELKAAHPDIVAVFVKPETAATWASRVRQIDPGSG